MLDKKNQEGQTDDLDDILKDFDEQDELHQRIQEFKKKKEAGSVQAREPIQAQREEAVEVQEDIPDQPQEEELGRTKISFIAQHEEPAAPKEDDETNATVIISEDEMRKLLNISVSCYSRSWD